MPNIFVGSSAVRNYLDAAMHTQTSCVELPSELTGASKEKRARLFLKMMGPECPLNTFKVVPVGQWFKKQARLGTLIKGVTTVVINSSGGAALAAAVYAREYGVRIVVIMPGDAPTEKQRLVRSAVGDIGELILSREIPGQPTGVEQARELGLQKDHLTFDQYGDPTNWEAHFEITISQIFQQMAEIDIPVGAIVASQGTTGTLMAIKKYGSEYHHDVIPVGVIAREEEPIPAVRPESRLGPTQILFDWRKGTTIVRVSRYETYAMAIKAVRRGFNVGLSSAAALVGAARFIETTTAQLQGKAVVVVAGDTLHPYLEQLRVILDPKDL